MCYSIATQNGSMTCPGTSGEGYIGTLCSAQQPPFEKGLHVVPVIGDAMDDHIFSDDAVDHAPGLVMQFPIVGDD